ncbi:Cell wall hydrolase/autolysin [metagenome]|uniref:Cell wall hydrolase/autolysin n=1 Tax=metagenome TaxID=256318 RepID=A0A2P2C090_9ZZZZ
MGRLLMALLLLAGATAAGVALVQGTAETPVARAPSTIRLSPAASPPPQGRPTRLLAGRVIVLDAGHQLGNRSFPDEIATLVEAGGFQKPCNSTGTSTDAGYPEATFTFQVVRRAAHELRSLGATVVLTRPRNSGALWGPCVDARGRAGNRIGADVKVSVHADGSWEGSGFHVIYPVNSPGWTDDVYEDSRALARALRDALRASGHHDSTYAGRDGLDQRRDLATLNLSDVPVAMVEAGNMRDATEAAMMQSPAARRRYADAIVTGVLTFLAP